MQPLYDLSVGGKLFVWYGVESFADTLRERELVGENSSSGSGNNRPCFLGVEERNCGGWLHPPTNKFDSLNLFFLYFVNNLFTRRNPRQPRVFSALHRQSPRDSEKCEILTFNVIF